MAINIKTYVDINSSVRVNLNKSSLSKKDVFYPDSVVFKYIDLFEYEDKDGNLQDGEMHYFINVNGSSTKSGEYSKEVVELSNFLRSYDFKKYPLQLETSIFEQYREWASEVDKFVSKRTGRESNSILSAKDLLAKLKK